jgi:hypothetical protein
MFADILLIIRLRAPPRPREWRQSLKVTDDRGRVPPDQGKAVGYIHVGEVTRLHQPLTARASSDFVAEEAQKTDPGLKTGGIWRILVYTSHWRR